MATITMRDLLEAGIHFGHQTRRWNPKMGRYIFGERHGIYIIDLQKTLGQLQKAYITTRDVAAKGGTVLFVGTKKQAREPIQQQAERCGMYYVNNRWLGGTLTNWMTIRNSIRSLLRLEEMETSGKIEAFSKKEVIRIRKDRDRLDKNLSGIKSMEKLPSLMFVIDSHREEIAVREAERVRIPCIAIVDTNADPDKVPIPVPGNDDAIRAISLFCSIIADAVIEGRSIYEKERASEEAEAAAARAAAEKESDDAEPSGDEPDASSTEESDETSEPAVAATGDASDKPSEM